ncbi:PTS fructose transporter subunit IIB [Enterococcus rivorum]|uniref:PTS fructose transporter subunit IIB n=1 Tax=Enterococcus rivorum TaxID=762845 RepID=A0A1E5L0P3_9ENTE|nr:PTS fructose transporter subunit IIB [Enterococcus rivorum]MBP2098446.1 PTS system fructose-specific IIB component [Enterococcus rivorum]OEH83700.1 PTS fructose transporter subunit IIB [Enterococcus rivorum]
MRLVAVVACTSGIAHTYIAKEKLISASEKRGHTIKVETQGTIGVENELTSDDIKKADVVIMATDIQTTGNERFDGKKIIKVPTNVAVKAAGQLIKKIDNEFNKGD